MFSSIYVNGPYINICYVFVKVAFRQTLGELFSYSIIPHFDRLENITRSSYMISDDYLD